MTAAMIMPYCCIKSESLVASAHSHEAASQVGRVD
jgi:hypothetical protein